eukprot:CAMPEP_0185265762 /NCGR_PEP_ID=MMETSP1359-20130426/28747_1 /TAXON_ID=552665 /ORGANISM="Bigelowiella longifila, Strain CCMP242" /LENGTH=259 /DNA_ID=CAMNT_0027855239 /DNA_START=32 /DNA_END=811 /DNA_ORIENTATION=-
MEDDGKVGILTLNRPGVLNAMTVEMGEAFESQISNLPDSTRCLVLTGAGRAFSAGGDLEFLYARANDTPHNNTQEMLRFYARFLCLRNVKVPVISAINGAAVGAGLCLAMATDIRITYSECNLQFPFASLGLHPGMGATFFLPRVAGYETATRLLLTGESITGAKAKELGMVSECTERQDQVVSKALEVARMIARNPATGIETCLKTLRCQQDSDVNGLQAALMREADAQASCYATEDLMNRLVATTKAIAERKAAKMK